MVSDVVILAGGFGERLWPASGKDYPKQFLKLDGNLSFLQQSLIRALYIKPEGKILIVTRLGLEKTIAQQCCELFESQDEETVQKIKDDVIIISEPKPRHTTAPIVLACHYLNMIAPDVKHSILVLTSDHIIGPLSAFKNDVEKAHQSAEKGHFITFGIQPYEPATGYGYIITGDAEKDNPQVYAIKEFKEKPDKQTAEKFIAMGNCRWNSGMFTFTADFFLEELKKCTPEAYDAFICVSKGAIPKVDLIDGIQMLYPWPEAEHAYDTTPAIAVDKSIAEKTNNAYSVLATFTWDDVGTWDSFEKHFHNKTDNAILAGSENCFVYSDIPVAICGLDDVTVVIKNGKALVMRKGCSSLVREAAQHFSD